MRSERMLIGTRLAIFHVSRRILRGSLVHLNARLTEWEWRLYRMQRLLRLGVYPTGQRDVNDAAYVTRGKHDWQTDFEMNGTRERKIVRFRCGVACNSIAESAILPRSNLWRKELPRVLRDLLGLRLSCNFHERLYFSKFENVLLEHFKYDSRLKRIFVAGTRWKCRLCLLTLELPVEMISFGLLIW